MKLSPDPVKAGEFLKKGPLPFILLYTLAILSPLIIGRLLGIEHGGGKREFAVGSGMVALMLLLTTFLLSGRFNWVAGKRGLDLTLKFHRRVAFIALVFLLLHIFLIAPFSMPNNIGLPGFAILLVVILIFIAKGHSKMKLKYEYWRLSHGVMAMLIVSMMTAHAIIEGNYSSHPVLTTYWLLVTMVAILSLFYVHQYLPRQEMKRPYRLVDIHKEAENQWTISMEPEGFEAMDYEAGQYAFVSFGASPFKDRAHPFSFSSSPSDRPRISFTIKAVGDFTKTVKNLEPGSKAYLYGPYGHMSRDHHRGPKYRGRGLVLLAAGVGFTPMMSILRDIRARNDQDPVKVYYSCRYEEDILYRQELESKSKELNMELTLILSRPSDDWNGAKGRLDKKYISDHITFPYYEEYLYFVCGTTGFVIDTVKALETVEGIPVFNIRFEDFSVYS